MSNRITVLLNTNETDKTLHIKILDPESADLQQVGGDRPLIHRQAGRYSTDPLTGLTGSAAYPKEYIGALYEGIKHHSDDAFWWDGSNVYEEDPRKPEVEAIASTSSNNENPTALPYDGGVIYQRVYTPRNIPKGDDTDKVKASL